MAVNLEDIKRMREEMEQDLKALDRVEKLLRDRSGSNTNGHRAARPAARKTAPKSQAPSKTSSVHTELIFPDNTPISLKDFVLKQIVDAGSRGIRPKDIVTAAISAGYTFSSKEIAASSISTAVRRMYKTDMLRKAGENYVYLQ